MSLSPFSLKYYVALIIRLKIIKRLTFEEKRTLTIKPILIIRCFHGALRGKYEKHVPLVYLERKLSPTSLKYGHSQLLFAVNRFKSLGVRSGEYEG